MLAPTANTATNNGLRIHKQSTVRFELINTMSGSWDAVFESDAGELSTRPIFIIANVRQIVVCDDGSTNRIEDQIVPVDPNDCEQGLYLVERPDYRGVIPSGESPTDPKWNIWFAGGSPG